MAIQRLQRRFGGIGAVCHWSRSPRAVGLRQNGKVSKAVGIVYHGIQDAETPATLEGGRFAGIGKELEGAGARAIPVVYNDDIAAEFLERAAKVDALLVWVNPITDGRDRSVLDDTLRAAASRGVLVSAHPDTILKMGTKQVLFDTRKMAWGTDVRVYQTLDELVLALPARLAAGPKVLKQYRGHSGGGIWKVEATPEGRLRLRHALRGSKEFEAGWDDFDVHFGPYFAKGGRVIEQPFQDRLREGMIRCYQILDRVEGFGHQAVNALCPGLPGEPPPEPGPRLYSGPDDPRFQRLKHLMEREWIQDMMHTLDMGRDELPLLWDADFLLGPPDPDGNDTYVLCEINVSSVSPFPPSAERPLAQATMSKLETP